MGDAEDKLTTDPVQLSEQAQVGEAEDNPAPDPMQISEEAQPGDAEDNSAPDPVQLSEEAQAINFEWTPELVKIATSGNIHPSAGTILYDRGFPKSEYRSDLVLPDPDDALECLKAAGLSDEKATEVEQNYSETHPHYRELRHLYSEEHTSSGQNRITFPVVSEMLELYLKDLPYYSDDHEDTHEGYIKRGIQLGLRPEFAIFLGLHETDPRVIDNPELFTEGWFNRGPEDIIRDQLFPWWMQLRDFMRDKLVHDEKAWQDSHGVWLVHDGETMDQAKARLDDLELQRLREEGAKEEERIREERRQQDQKAAAVEEEHQRALGLIE